MKITMVASEAAPFLKTGGLGDVIQALPEQLAKLPNLEISLSFLITTRSGMPESGKRSSWGILRYR